MGRPRHKQQCLSISVLKLLKPQSESHRKLTSVHPVFAMVIITIAYVRYNKIPPKTSINQLWYWNRKQAYCIVASNFARAKNAAAIKK